MSQSNKISSLKNTSDLGNSQLNEACHSINLDQSAHTSIKTNDKVSKLESDASRRSQIQGFASRSQNNEE